MGVNALTVGGFELEVVRLLQFRSSRSPSISVGAPLQVPLFSTSIRPSTLRPASSTAHPGKPATFSNATL